MLTSVQTLTHIGDQDLVNTTMPGIEYQRMAKSRALITEREREQIAGEHGSTRKYEATSRVRSRVRDELGRDIELLRRHHPDLLGEIREVVCDD